MDSAAPVPQRLPVSTWLIAFSGWMFDFYDLVLFSFLLTPISRELQLTNWQQGSGMEKLLSKYGFNEKRFRESKPKQFVPGEGARAALHRRYAETIKDKVGFAVEMKQLFGSVVRQMPLREAVQPTEADNITISGDRARAKILKTSIAGLSEQPVAFQRIDGRWYVELLPHKRD